MCLCNTFRPAGVCPKQSCGANPSPCIRTSCMAPCPLVFRYSYCHVFLWNDVCTQQRLPNERTIWLGLRGSEWLQRTCLRNKQSYLGMAGGARLCAMLCAMLAMYSSTVPKENQDSYDKIGQVMCVARKNNRQVCYCDDFVPGKSNMRCWPPGPMGIEVDQPLLGTSPCIESGPICMLQKGRCKEV